MVSLAAIFIVNSVNLVATCVALWFCFVVIFCYILRQGINKMFVNLFYIQATLILLSLIVLSLFVFIYVPHVDKTFKDDMGTNELGISIINSIHQVCYIGLILLMVCTILQI